jgi:hypothetical protein
MLFQAVDTSSIKVAVKNMKAKREHVRIWLYSKPEFLPPDVVDRVYKNDRPHGESDVSRTSSPFTTKGMLRKSGSLVQAHMQMNTNIGMGGMMMQNGMGMGMGMGMDGASGSSSSSGLNMPMAGNMMQSFMQHMAYQAFQQVQTRHGTPDIQLYSPAPKVRQHHALPTIPGTDSQHSPADAHDEQHLRQDSPAGSVPFPGKLMPITAGASPADANTGISAEEAARIVAAAMAKAAAGTNAAAGTAGVLKRPAGAAEPKAKAASKAKAKPKAAAKAAPKGKAKAAPKAKAKAAQKAKGAKQNKTNRMPDTMAKRLKLRPRGCSKCRYKKPGCFPSCWS